MKTTPENQEGLVISYFGNKVEIEAADGQTFKCHLRRNQPLPIVGDRVIFHRDSKELGVIDSIVPRRSMLGKGDGRGGIKGVAANVDLTVIVMSPPPVFSEYLIDRYALAAELLGIQPMVVVNKADLMDNDAQLAVEERLAPYKQAGYQTLFTSVHQDSGIVELGAELKNKTAVLVGPSGVGKSSIIAHLLGSDAIRVGEVSAKGAGKHTTTATKLYHLNGGGQLIDSPGVREFNLWPITYQEVLMGFKEFEKYAPDCKFRNCRHLSEPKCAVQAAIDAGKINTQRYEIYKKLVQEIKK